MFHLGRWAFHGPFVNGERNWFGHKFHVSAGRDRRHRYLDALAPLRRPSAVHITARLAKRRGAVPEQPCDRPDAGSSPSTPAGPPVNSKPGPSQPKIAIDRVRYSVAQCNSPAFSVGDNSARIASHTTRKICGSYFQIPIGPSLSHRQK